MLMEVGHLEQWTDDVDGDNDHDNSATIFVYIVSYCVILQRDRRKDLSCSVVQKGERWLFNSLTNSYKFCFTFFSLRIYSGHVWLSIPDVIDRFNNIIVGISGRVLPIQPLSVCADKEHMGLQVHKHAVFPRCLTFLDRTLADILGSGLSLFCFCCVFFSSAVPLKKILLLLIPLQKLVWLISVVLKDDIFPHRCNY